MDKILEIIQRKTLKGTYSHVMVKEIFKEYLLNSPYFKDIYLFST